MEGFSARWSLKEGVGLKPFSPFDTGWVLYSNLSIFLPGTISAINPFLIFIATAVFCVKKIGSIGTSIISEATNTGLYLCSLFVYSWLAFFGMCQGLFLAFPWVVGSMMIDFTQFVVEKRNGFVCG